MIMYVFKDVTLHDVPVVRLTIQAPESRTIQVETVEVEPEVPAPQKAPVCRQVETGDNGPKTDAGGPKSKIGGQRSDVSPVGTGQRPSREAEGPGDDRRPVNLHVVVKTTVNGKKAGNRLPKKSGEDRLDGEVNGGGSGVNGSGVHGSTVQGSGVQGSAGGDAEGRVKCMGRGPDPGAAAVAVGKTERDGVLRSVNNWHEVVLSGETISLRNREKVKDLLRFLEAGGATRRTKAIGVGKRFGKPSTLFLPGGRYVREGAGSGGREVAVGSQLGALIQRVYREGVGKVPPARKGTGATLYYLRVFRDSDVT